MTTSMGGTRAMNESLEEARPMTRAEQAALKRTAAWLSSSAFHHPGDIAYPTDGEHAVTVADLRTVLGVADAHDRGDAEVADLKRRIRLARRKLALLTDDDPQYLVNVAHRILDLRRPLPRRT